MKFAANYLIALSAIASISTVDSTSAAINSNGDFGVNAKKLLSVDHAVDFLAEKFAVDKDPNLSLETKLFLGEVDCALTKAVATMAGPKFVGEIADGGEGDDTWLKSEEVTMGWIKVGPVYKKSHTPLFPLKISPKFQTSMLNRADIRENDTLENVIDGSKQRLVLELARLAVTSDVIFPLDDSTIAFGDEAQALRIANDLLFAQGKALPLSFNTDFNMKTDKSFSRIFFHGIAAPLMEISDEVTDPEHLKYGPFMVDMEFMNCLEVRRPELFKNYGARVHFDANQMVSAIYDCDMGKLVLPGQPEWEEAKFQAKVSAFLLTTAREHLLQTHFLVSNNASREVVKTLPPDHPIRRLLAIFTYNAVGINKTASIALTPENSLIHRATALSYQGMLDVFDNAFSTSIALKPFTDRIIKNPEVKKLASEGKYPYLSEGREFYEITRTMVKAWLEKAGKHASDRYAKDFYNGMKESTVGQEHPLPEYSHDNMVDLVSSVIFGVTAYHELIGHVPDYTDSPFKAGFRVPRTSPLQVDFQSFLLTAVISAATSLPAPQLLAEFPNYIAKGGAPEWERDIWDVYVKEMGLQSKKVQNDDWKNRDFEFKYFDPSLFECSVSV